MKTNALIASLLLLICAGSVPLCAQQYSDDDLIRMGNQAWQQQRCVRAAEFLFAYLVRNPEPVRNDSAYRSRLQNAINWCEQNTSVYAGSKGDEPGHPAPPRPPAINLAPSPIAPPLSAIQKRCNIYATLAAAQGTANSASGCGYGGSRWNSSYDFHYQYCLVAPPADTFSETQTRQNLLQQCAP